MIKLLCSGLFLVLLLSGCGWDGTATRHNDLSPPTSIAIAAGSSVIANHTSTVLTVTGSYPGGYTLPLTDQAVWSSDSPAVADFSAADNPNRVFAHAPGTAVLTATVRGVSTTFQLTVSPATILSLAVTTATPSVAKGGTAQFDVSGTFSDNTTQNLTYDASWASSDASVATVSDAAGSKGLANARAVGTTTITATLDGVSGGAVLTVTAPVIESVAIAPASADLTVGGSQNFTVKAKLSDGTTQDVTAGSEWSSSSAAIATVGNSAADKGKVTAVAAGTATISAVYGSFPAVTANVTVVAKIPASLALNVNGTANVGGYTFEPGVSVVVFTATATYSDSSTADVTGQATWASSNQNVASLDTAKPGQVTRGAAGSSILTATFGGKTTSVTIFVP